jgi:sugar phosphate isomerase/epimerase
LNRRTFIQGTTYSALASPLLATLTPAEKLPIGFSTLGCPAWQWGKILDFAQANGFSAIELRGIQGTMDLPSRREFTSERIAQSKKEIAAHELKISCVSSSSEMHEPDPQKHDAALADARRFIDLAQALGAPYVRVFGNKIIGDRDAAIKRVSQSLHSLGEYAGPRNVTVIIESHGDFTNSPLLRLVIEAANSPHVALLWDANHTYVDGREEPALTVSQLGKYIRHTHLKDSVRKGDDVQYVLTGRGEVPVRQQVQELVNIGYTGSFSYEWEKAWHPDLEDPEIAFPDYARAMRGYLTDALAKRKSSTRRTDAAQHPA